jgi:hypothetical protein
MSTHQLRPWSQVVRLDHDVESGNTAVAAYAIDLGTLLCATHSHPGPECHRGSAVTHTDGATADFHPYSAAFPNGYPGRAISHCAVSEPERARRTGYGTCGDHDGRTGRQTAGHRPQHQWLMAGNYLDSKRGAASGQVFHFPAGLIMQPGQVCRVYTDEVHPEWCGLSFGYGRSGVWNNSEPDAAVLFDGDEAVVSRWE